MREIKFRAWDKEKQRWVCGSPLSLCVWLKSDANEWLGNDIYLKNIDFQQFTGLEDKNGNEIYEGDIVKGKFPINTWKDKKIITVEVENLIAKVKYGMGSYVLEFTNLKSPDWIEQSQSSVMRFLYACSDFEVIGNIWEHPKLLNSK